MSSDSIIALQSPSRQQKTLRGGALKIVTTFGVVWFDVTVTNNICFLYVVISFQLLLIVSSIGGLLTFRTLALQFGVFAGAVFPCKLALATENHNYLRQLASLLTLYPVYSFSTIPLFSLKNRKHVTPAEEPISLCIWRTLNIVQHCYDCVLLRCK